MREVVQEFYEELSSLAQRFDELTDTDVREALSATLDYFFVWGKSDPRGMPVCYEMFSAEGDKAVSEVVNKFVSKALKSANQLGMSPGKPRLNALQDQSIVTSEGLTYDYFIGHADAVGSAEPLWDGRFEAGEYDDDD